MYEHYECSTLSRWAFSVAGPTSGTRFQIAQRSEPRFRFFPFASFRSFQFAKKYPITDYYLNRITTHVLIESSTNHPRVNAIRIAASFDFCPSPGIDCLYWRNSLSQCCIDIVEWTRQQLLRFWWSLSVRRAYAQSCKSTIERSSSHAQHVLTTTQYITYKPSKYSNVYHWGHICVLEIFLLTYLLSYLLTSVLSLISTKYEQ